MPGCPANLYALIQWVLAARSRSSATGRAYRRVLPLSADWALPVAQDVLAALRWAAVPGSAHRLWLGRALLWRTIRARSSESRAKDEVPWGQLAVGQGSCALGSRGARALAGPAHSKGVVVGENCPRSLDSLAQAFH